MWGYSKRIFSNKTPFISGARQLMFFTAPVYYIVQTLNKSPVINSADYTLWLILLSEGSSLGLANSVNIVICGWHAVCHCVSSGDLYTSHSSRQHCHYIIKASSHCRFPQMKDCCLRTWINYFFSGIYFFTELNIKLRESSENFSLHIFEVDYRETKQC